MDEDVLVTISGNRMLGEDSENVSVIYPAKYSMENGKHSVTYEEPMEGVKGGTINTIQIGSNGMDITKKGIVNTHMSFLCCDKKITTCYSTPFGDFIIGIRTNDISIDESENRMRVNVDYSMDVEHEHISDCNMVVDICSKKVPISI